MLMHYSDAVMMNSIKLYILAGNRMLLGTRNLIFDPSAKSDQLLVIVRCDQVPVELFLSMNTK